MFDQESPHEHHRGVGESDMGRQDRSTLNGFSGSDLGRWIGEAIGEGIALGTQKAFEEVGQELAPLVEAMVQSLRQELTASLANTAENEAFVEAVEGARTCAEQGCGEPSLARSLCRRHYARKLYQERKERLGTGSTGAPRRRQSVLRAVSEGEETVNDRKLAAVAPIIRRKKSELPVAAERTPEMAQPLAAAANGGPMAAFAAAGAAAPNVSVESVARFFGLNKG